MIEMVSDACHRIFVCFICDVTLIQQLKFYQCFKILTINFNLCSFS